MRRVPVLLLLWLLAARPALPAQTPPPGEPPRASVGMAGRLTNLVLPGTELEAVPAEAASKIVVRLVEVRPHGTAHRYDLEFTGFEPGRYDLRGFLRRKDGSSLDGLPELPVDIVSAKPAGSTPNPLQPVKAPRLGGYRTLLWVAGAVWVAGLLLILFAGRRKRRLAEAPSRQPTLAERLRPMVEDAIAGQLDPTRRAELERLLLGYWRVELGLEGKPMAVAIPALRQHEKAGALLRELERWLHAPPGGGSVDVGALLRPYESLPAQPAAERVA